MMKTTRLILFCFTVTVHWCALAQDNTSEGARIVAQLRSAAEKGDVKAQFLLGIRHSKGDGVSFDRIEAYRWLHLAVEGGNLEAIMPRYDVSQGMSQKEITEAKERSGKSSNLSQSSRSSSDSSGNGTSVGGANTQPSSGRSGSSTVIATKGFLTEKDLKVSPGKTVTSVVGADVITAVSVKGGNTGLKDVEGNRTETTTDGTRYTVATGETVESGEFPSGRFIVISAGSLKAQTENSITVQFDDNSTRTWQITPTTPVCDEKGQRLGKSELTNGILLAVRWEAQGRQALNLATLGNALSVRRGGLRYKFAEPDGRLVQPTAPVDCACSAR